MAYLEDPDDDGDAVRDRRREDAYEAEQERKRQQEELDNKCATERDLDDGSPEFWQNMTDDD